MAAEDFAFYSNRVSAAFWFLGLRPEGSDHHPMLHTSQFDFPDEVIPMAVRMHCETVKAFFATHQ
jgi:metal-dependent amidase/aminoacylase/carboxypeptidase family protein